MSSNSVPSGTVAAKAGVVDRYALDQVVLIIRESLSDPRLLTGWETQFVNSVSYQIKWKLLTERQQATLDEIFNYVEAQTGIGVTSRQTRVESA